MKKYFVTAACSLLILFILTSCAKNAASSEANTHDTARKITASIPLSDLSHEAVADYKQPTLKSESADPNIIAEKKIPLDAPPAVEPAPVVEPAPAIEPAPAVDNGISPEAAGAEKAEPVVEPVKKVEPKKEKSKAAKKQQTKEDKKKSTVIASFSTHYNAGNKGRTTNIKLAAKKINGTIVKPGAVFSYNKVLGSTGKANGYKLATVFVDGKEEKGYGGGICQLSSTIYNACQKADLKIVERHAHSLPVSYVKKGQDATTSQRSGKDFRFKNTRDYPIRIYAKAAKGTLSVSLEKA